MTNDLLIKAIWNFVLRNLKVPMSLWCSPQLCSVDSRPAAINRKSGERHATGRDLKLDRLRRDNTMALDCVKARGYILLQLFIKTFVHLLTVCFSKFWQFYAHSDSKEQHSGLFLSDQASLTNATSERKRKSLINIFPSPLSKLVWNFKHKKTFSTKRAVLPTNLRPANEDFMSDASSYAKKHFFNIDEEIKELYPLYLQRSENS